MEKLILIYFLVHTFNNTGIGLWIKSKINNVVGKMKTLGKLAWFSSFLEYIIACAFCQGAWLGLLIYQDIYIMAQAALFCLILDIAFKALTKYVKIMNEFNLDSDCCGGNESNNPFE